MTQAITFYLVRHGEAENNVRHILNSAPIKKEYSLTECGKKQIREVASFLAPMGVDAIFSSPLLRTKQTAEIIARATGLTITYDDRLWEAGMGVFNEQSQQLLLKKYPDPQMRLSPDPIDHMESFMKVRSRLDDFLNELKEKYTGKKVILVSHGDPLEQLYGILTHEGPGRAAEGWHPKKGSCTKVVWQW